MTIKPKTAKQARSRKNQQAAVRLGPLGLEGIAPSAFATYVYQLPARDRIDLIRQGVSAKLVVQTEQQLGLARQGVCQMLGLSVSTIKRRLSQDQALNADETERLLALQQLIGQVAAIVEESGDASGFDAARWVGEWLMTPNPALAGQKPADYMDTAEGRRLVSRAIAMMRSGAYA